MGQPYHSEFNINHEQLYSELKRLKSENYHLSRQLINQRSVNRNQSRHIAKLEKKLKAANGKGQRYRNGQKRGSHGFNG